VILEFQPCNLRLHLRAVVARGRRRLARRRFSRPISDLSHPVPPVLRVQTSCSGMLGGGKPTQSPTHPNLQKGTASRLMSRPKWGTARSHDCPKWGTSSPLRALHHRERVFSGISALFRAKALAHLVVRHTTGGIRCFPVTLNTYTELSSRDAGRPRPALALKFARARGGAQANFSHGATAPRAMGCQRQRYISARGAPGAWRNSLPLIHAALVERRREPSAY